MTSPPTPDARALTTATAQLAADLAQVLAADPRPDDMPALARLAGALAEVTERITWARDAALHAARRDGVKLRTLYRETGVADSTLSQREQAWLRRNRTV